MVNDATVNAVTFMKASAAAPSYRYTGASDDGPGMGTR